MTDQQAEGRPRPGEAEAAGPLARGAAHVTPQVTDGASRLALANRLKALGLPVVAVRPNDAPRQGNWQHLTANECDLSLYRPGDALALVTGHGIDVVDVDIKDGGSVEHLPPFQSYGMTRTPSGGQHYIVPSSGHGKVGKWRTEAGPVGDYLAGRADGSGRALAFLPGSVRDKYPGGEYVEEVRWDIKACLAAEPDADLLGSLPAAKSAPTADSTGSADGGPERPAEDGLHPYAARAIEAELARLENCDLLGFSGPHWDATTYEVACNLIEFANARWSGYTLEQAESDLMERAPADGDFGPQKHAAKWASAQRKVGAYARPCPDSRPEDDFGPLGRGDVFDATPVLGHIRQAAHARMLSAPGLLGYVLARVLAQTPPTTALPAVIGGRAALNLGVAVVGGSGAGKSALLAVSRDLLGLTGLDQEPLEHSVGSGEGLVQLFLEWDKTSHANVLVDDPRRIVTVDEIDQMGATKNRTGATISPVMRSALTGSALGQANATAERTRRIPADSYRLVMLLGVQPSRSETLLNEADAGTPQRLVWVRATDATLPREAPAWPGAIGGTGWDLPRDVPADISYPDHVMAEVREARWRHVHEGADPLLSHQLLTRLKVATALALLHGEVAITDQWWGLAGQVMADSLAVQAECRAVLAEVKAQERHAAGRLSGIQLEGAADYLDERVMRAAKALLRKVLRHSSGVKDGNDQRHEPGEGCTRRCGTRALRDTKGGAELYDAALAYAEDSDWIVRRQDRWFPGGSQPADQG